MSESPTLEQSQAPTGGPVCAVDQSVTPTAAVVVPTSFDMSGKGWFTSNYYGQVWVQNLSASCALVLNAPSNPYQMALGNQFPVTIYPGQYLALYYYVEGGTFVESGDSTMTIPYQLQPIFGYRDTSLGNNGYSWWKSNQSMTPPVTGNLIFTCDPGYTQGNVYLSATVSGASTTGQISSAAPHQRPSGNYFDDMTFAVMPGGPVSAPTTSYSSSTMSWLTTPAGWACDIAWIANQGAYYFNSAFLVVKLVARLLNNDQRRLADEQLEARDRLHEASGGASPATPPAAAASSS